MDIGAGVALSKCADVQSSFNTDSVGAGRGIRFR